MLKQIRTHASPWVIRTILFIIILPFVLFFSYDRISDRFQSGNAVAKVGSKSISSAVFKARLEESLRQMREIFKENMPEGMEASIRGNVLNEIISREVMVHYAKKMGLEVSPKEIAKNIKENKNLFPDGVIDSMRLQAYNDLRKRYRQMQGEDFEDVVQRQLYVEKTQALGITLFSTWKTELDESLKVAETLPVAQETRPKRRGQKLPPETQPQTRPVAGSGPGPFELFDAWLDNYKERRIKVEVF